MKTGLKSLVLASLLANATLSSHAQTTAPTAAPKPAASASSPRMHEGRLDSAKMEDKMNKHLAELKTKLKIAAPQEGAWTTFTAALKPTVRQAHTRPDPSEMEKLTTPERIDKMRALRAQRRTEMQAQMDKREDATKTFYTTLNAEQKKVFDAEHSKMMRRGNERTNHGSRPDTTGLTARP